MRQKICDQGLIGATARGERAVRIEGLTCALADEIIDHGRGGAGIECGNNVAIERGDIGDAAKIEHHEGLCEMACQGLMVERDKRRALSACGEIRVPEAVDACEPEPVSRALAVHQLAGEATLRAVKDSLAMKADAGDRSGRHVVCVEDVCDGIAMGVGDGVFKGGEIAAFSLRGGVDDRDERLAQPGRIGKGCAGAMLDQVATIGAQQGDVDAIHRCATDHPDRPFRFCIHPGAAFVHLSSFFCLMIIHEQFIRFMDL